VDELDQGRTIVGDFERAKRTARRRRIMARLLGRDINLLPFEEVRHSLGSKDQGYRGVRPVRIDQIIGSLGRSDDFDRAFSPTQTHSRRKWLSVDSAYFEGKTLPPISLYKIGEAYFVVDGHHRVSVARQKGVTFIDAEVIEVSSRIPVTADLRVSDLDGLRAYREFLDETQLDRLRPDQDMRLSMPGDYARLQEHIQVHKYLVETSQELELTDETAVTHWYDRVYMPVVETIRKHKLLADFPGRTEADLYLWMIEHAYYLSQEIGHELSPLEVARDYVSRYGRRPKLLCKRIWQKIVNLFVPEEVQPGPPAGTWRRERVEMAEAKTLFRDILVTATGAETGWRALAQAAEIARLEGSTLRGLHVMPADNGKARAHGQEVLKAFGERCQQLGIACTTSLAHGDVADRIIERSRWVDLVVINQRRVHGRWAERPLGTIFQTVASHVARPVLAVPGAELRPIRRVVLAYDGSPKSREALFVLKHMLQNWQVQATIVSVADGGTDEGMLDDVCGYLGEGQCPVVDRRYVEGPVDEAILRVMEEVEGDLLLMGGFGHQPLLKAFLGSTVDRVLRMAWFPVLVCR